MKKGAQQYQWQVGSCKGVIAHGNYFRLQDPRIVRAINATKFFSSSNYFTNMFFSSNGRSLSEH